jgi:small subunit ribosomal protein S19
MTIDISCIDINFKVYNGTRFFEILVNKNMLGHKFGEFAPSKIKTVHKKKK